MQTNSRLLILRLTIVDNNAVVINTPISIMKYNITLECNFHAFYSGQNERSSDLI